MTCPPYLRSLWWANYQPHQTGRLIERALNRFDQTFTGAFGRVRKFGHRNFIDQHVDLVEQAQRIAAFFRSESCGQCVPCRVGTVRQQEAVDRLADGSSRQELQLLDDIGRAMSDASICGLGHTAHHAIESLVTLGAFDREPTRSGDHR
ncbi:MAG: hypothetical protein HC809_15705 [Gammaproteobacteria bacterium]|nr:hypothetical protein [Gammaproteobacteria bacterium]